MDASRTRAPRRSIHIFGSLATGGAETWFLRLLASRPPGCRWSADVCLLDPQPGPYVERARELGAEILECPFRPAATFPWRLHKLLRGQRYDVVHSHVLLFGGVIAAAAAAAGVPVRVAHAHNSRDGRGGSAGRFLYRAGMRAAMRRFANLGLACSRGAAKMLGLRDVKLLPYGLDLNPCETLRGSLKAELGWTEDAFVLGAVGRLHPQKNHAFLLEAFAEARQWEPRLRLAIVGEGELRPALEERIADLGLDGLVRLTGRRGDVAELLHGLFDAFVMPSLYEGLPVALLEGQAAGLPCLVSDRISREAFAIPELIGSAALDAGWARRLADLPGRRRLASKAARELLRDAGFAIDDAWRRLTAYYDGVLEQAESADEDAADWAEAA
ncbi:MAG: glycosyltransferase [Acidobacteria bacterium]|nr:glycosyltransferase [Acidobacteriota bacterium]